MRKCCYAERSGLDDGTGVFYVWAFDHGTGDDLTSIWLITWDPHTVYGIYPVEPGKLRKLWLWVVRWAVRAGRYVWTRGVE